MNKEEAKKRIAELVERYNKLVAEGKNKEYQEADTEKDLILPLFEALGWDVRNKEEVAAQAHIAPKGRADYSFKINGIPKFYLEAKALKKELGEANIEQAIDYSYAKGCTWAVLTNFKRIEVYNAEWKERNPGRNILFALNVNQFLTDERFFLLSRESFEKGLIDKYAEYNFHKTRKIPIDKQLLNDLTVFRELLSKNISKNNSSKNLTGEELDEAVQRILDRLIFIRYLEDRGFESPLLQPLVRDYSSKKPVYTRLKEVSRNIGIPYNSILFISHLIDDLIIDDDVMEKVINGLFKTSDETVRYDFAIISADVIGNVYEQYLGHILKKTEKRAKLTEGKVHRKEQGIYYTPTYIVDYIVKNTLGELLKGKNVDTSKIKILDPACGSGSFLIKAFDVLEEYQDKHNKRYSDAKKELDFSRISKVKTDIVLNNLHGVDLDSRAVEIAQLNLLLKMAEKRQKLPMLNHTIKCGNSLIDDPEIAGEKFAFKWEKEFQEIMEDGGFDVVVGNPPYVRIHEFDEKIKDYFSIYDSATGQYDIYVLFIERALKLLKNGGLLGFIVSNKFLVSDYGMGLRKVILSSAEIKRIVDVSNMNVFKDASVYPIVIILEKTNDKKQLERNKITVVRNVLTEKELLANKPVSYNQADFYKNKNLIIDVTSLNKDIIKKIESGSMSLGETTLITRGFRPPPKELVFSVPSKNLSKYVIGKDLIDAYNIKWSGNFVKYDETVIAEAKPINVFLQPKILIRDIGKVFNASYDSGEYLCLKTIYFIYSSKNCDLKYILGILNSKLMLFYFESKFSIMHIQGGYLRFRKQFLEQLPIKQIPESQQQPLIKLVDKMLSLNKRLNELGDKKTTERERIEKEIKETDTEIDEFVYKIYGITEEEKKVIEESLG